VFLVWKYELNKIENLALNEAYRAVFPTKESKLLNFFCVVLTNFVADRPFVEP
jgi:hypothetical protein